MNNYNSPAYYRSNPYSDIGYMPPGAHRNRKKMNYGVQIPQGNQFFEPTTKKHYGRSYTTEIEAENVMRSPEKFAPIEQEALQKSYFRSLNSKDIEGAATNTLISKAVRNKLKAQQILQHKRQLQRLERQSHNNQQEKLSLYEEYHRNRQQNRSNQHKNFHTLQRTEKVEHQYQNPHNNYQMTNQNRQNNELIEEDQYNYRQKQMQMLKKAHQQNSSGLYNNNYQNISPQPIAHQLNHQQKDLKSSMYARNTPMNHPENNYHTRVPERNIPEPPPERFYHTREPEKNIPEPPSERYYRDEMYNKNMQILEKNNQKNPQQPGRNQYQQYNNSMGRNRSDQYIKQSSPQSPGFKNREQLRRNNPTYLSYGSPSFAVASRNVIGNQ